MLLEDVQTLEQVTDQQYQGYRVPAELLGVHAIACVIVAMMGLYAVMAYSVIERQREFALRIALGSTRQNIFRLVLLGSSSVAILGVVTGIVGSIAAVRLLRSVLFGVRPCDPVSTLQQHCCSSPHLLRGLFQLAAPRHDSGTPRHHSAGMGGNSAF